MKWSRPITTQNGPLSLNFWAGTMVTFLQFQTWSLTFNRVNKYNTRMKNSFYLAKPKTNALKRSFFYSALFHLNKLNITQDRLSDVKTLFLNSISYINENLSVSRIYWFSHNIFVLLLSYVFKQFTVFSFSLTIFVKAIWKSTFIVNMNPL